MKLNQKHPHYSLRLLVHSFEENPRELTTIHESFVSYYGYPLLARSLNFVYPVIPKFDRKPIENYIDTHEFSNYESLGKGIRQFKTDIEKLFAIFYWTARNIEYDLDSKNNPSRRKSQKSQDVFSNKKAVCEGYSSIVLSLAEQAGIEKIKLARFSNYAKGAGYNSFKPPNPEPASNHATVYVEINGIPYISEPTWGAGYTRDNKFYFCYNYHQFLIPFHYALIHYLPLDDSKTFLTFPFTYSDFLLSPAFLHPEVEIAAESHPFRRFEIDEGFIEMQFSCVSFDTILPTLHILDRGTFVEVSRDYIHIKILQRNLKSRYFTLHDKTHSRTRFKAQVGFPKVGVYKFQLFINTHQSYECFIDVKKKATRFPFLKYEDTDALFIPIVPTELITHVKSIALIRFAVAHKRSGVLLSMEKCKDGTLETQEKIDDCNNYYETMKIQIPFDDTRCEDFVTVVFPNKGRYKVCLFLANDSGTYTFFMNYYFDVDEGKTESVPPIEFLPEGRNSMQLVLKCPIISIDPPDSFIFKAEEGECVTVISTTQSLNLNLKYNGKTLFPSLLNTESINENWKLRYRLNFNGPGVYHLLYFADGKYVCTQDYLFGTSLNYADEEENNLMQKLKTDIDRYGTNIDELEDIPEHIRQSAMAHIGGGTQPPKMIEYQKSQEGQEAEETERRERERVERERKEKEERERVERERKETEERERVDKERKEKEERERVERERKENEEKRNKLLALKQRQEKEEKEKREKEEQMKRLQEEKRREEEKQKQETLKRLQEERERKRKEAEDRQRLENEEKERKKQEELEKQRKERREAQRKLKEKREQEIRERELKEKQQREQREKEDKERERQNKIYQEKIQKENEKRKRELKEIEDKARQEREKEQKKTEQLNKMKNLREQQLQEKLVKQQKEQAEKEKEEKHRRQQLIQDKERIERLRQRKIQQQLQKEKEEEEKKLVKSTEEPPNLSPQEQAKLIRQKLLRQKEKEIRERDQKLREQKFREMKLKEQQELERKEREQAALISYKRQVHNFYIQRNYQRMQYNKVYSDEPIPAKSNVSKSLHDQKRNKSVPKKLFTTSTQTDDLPVFAMNFQSPRVIEHVSQFFVGNMDVPSKSPRRIKAVPSSNHNLTKNLGDSTERTKEINFSASQSTNINTPRIIRDSNNNIIKPIQQPTSKGPKAPRMIKTRLPKFKEPE